MSNFEKLKKQTRLVFAEENSEETKERKSFLTDSAYYYSYSKIKEKE